MRIGEVLKSIAEKFGKLKFFVLVVLCFPVVILAVIFFWIADIFLTRRWPGPGFEYVYVNNAGKARELTKEERRYLTKKFGPGDGARPYIKFGYHAKTPDRKMHGFLLRRHLPRKIVIGRAPKIKR